MGCKSKKCYRESTSECIGVVSANVEKQSMISYTAVVGNSTFENVTDFTLAWLGMSVMNRYGG
jgi:hypothetical protein